MKPDATGSAETPEGFSVVWPEAEKNPRASEVEKAAYAKLFVVRLTVRQEDVQRELKLLMDAGDIETTEPCSVDVLQNSYLDDVPVTRSFLEEQALILLPEDLEGLEFGVDVIDIFGHRITIESGCIPQGSVLLIPPMVLGEEEGLPMLGVVG